MRVKGLMSSRMKSGPSAVQLDRKKKADNGKEKASAQLPKPILGRTQQRAPLTPAAAWKKSKLKLEEIHALASAGFLCEQAIDGWSTATGDALPMEKNPSEIPMFAHFCEHGLSLQALDFFRGLLDFYKIEHAHLNPNSIF